MRCAHDNHVHGGKRSDLDTPSCTTRYSNNQTVGYLVNDWHNFLCDLIATDVTLIDWPYDWLK
jgi:hypothetical protein